MQSSNVAATPAELPPEDSAPTVPQAAPKLFETGSFLVSPSISGTWLRPKIVMDNGPYQPFRVR